MSYFDVGATELVARQGYSGMGDFTDTVKGLLSGGLNFYGQAQQTAGKAAAYEEIAKAQAAAASGRKPPGRTPKWLLPVGLGAGALVLVLLLKKKR
jgi:hypothetical protein